MLHYKHKQHRHKRSHNFSIDRQRRHFACPFQAADDTMQIGVHITLYPIYATKKITHVKATAPKMRFVGSKVSFHIE